MPSPTAPHLGCQGPTQGWASLWVSLRAALLLRSCCELWPLSFLAALESTPAPGCLLPCRAALPALPEPDLAAKKAVCQLVTSNAASLVLLGFAQPAVRAGSPSQSWLLRVGGMKCGGQHNPLPSALICKVLGQGGVLSRLFFLVVIQRCLQLCQVLAVHFC